MERLPGMRRTRILATLAAIAAALVGTLAVATPARADTFGPMQNYGDNLCIQPQDNSPFQGTLIVQVPCQLTDGGTAANPFQVWYFNGSHLVNFGSGLCLRARGLTGPANGEQIMLWTCNSITDLNWTTHAVDVGSASILAWSVESRISGSTGYCLDVPGASGQIGLALQLWRCNGTVAQIWYSRINIT
jgi:hypothetical protein